LTKHGHPGEAGYPNPGYQTIVPGREIPVIQLGYPHVTTSDEKKSSLRVAYPFLGHPTIVPQRWRTPVIRSSISTCNRLKSGQEYDPIKNKKVQA
jgi:hypothetical protein